MANKSGISCPQCESSKTKSVPLTYRQEFKIRESSTSAVGISASGHVGFGGAVTRGTHISALGRSIAPPSHPHPATAGWIPALWLTASIVLLLIGWLLYALERDLGFKPVWPFYVGFPALGLGVWLHFLFKNPDKRRYYKAKKEYEAAYKQWEKQWICLQCGNIYEPKL